MLRTENKLFLYISQKPGKAYVLQQVMFCINLIYQLIFLTYEDKASNITQRT